MEGPFYFLSSRMASFIASDVLEHEKISHVEDMSTASYVWSHPGNVTIFEITRNQSIVSYKQSHNRGKNLGGRKFQGMAYGHTEDRCWTPVGPYFKRSGNVRKVWREFIVWRWSRQTFDFRDRYQLHDHPVSRNTNGNITVHPSDYIYSGDDFDASPIVIESPYNLVFFPITGVADVAWRCIIRRMLGHADWEDVSRQFDGLRYLSDYSVEEASKIMSSSDYTRAVFIRDPVDRIQSNYIKMVEFDKNHEMIRRCDCARDCDARWNQPTCGGKK